MKSHKLRHEPYHSDVSLVRGGILEQVMKVASSRFSVTASVDRPGVWVTDNKTGKEVQGPLFAAREVVIALNSLIGDTQ